MVEKTGIGPWALWTYGPHNLTNMRVRGVQVEYSMKLAIAWSGIFRWEIIQPLAGPSIYQEFLDQNGDGLHHLLGTHDHVGYDEARDEFIQRGCPPIMEGRMAERDIDFAYFEILSPQRFVIELSKHGPASKRVPAEKWYPYALAHFPD